MASPDEIFGPPLGEYYFPHQKIETEKHGPNPQFLELDRMPTPCGALNNLRLGARLSESQKRRKTTHRPRITWPTRRSHWISPKKIGDKKLARASRSSSSGERAFCKGARPPRPAFAKSSFAETIKNGLFAHNTNNNHVLTM